MRKEIVAAHYSATRISTRALRFNGVARVPDEHSTPEDIMERQFALPIAFAAAAHAALMFGFSRPPQTQPPIELTRIIPCQLTMPPPDIDPPVPEDSGAKSSAPKDLPDVPRPSQEEPIVINITEPFITPVALPSAISETDVRVIPSVTEIRGTKEGFGVGPIVLGGSLDKSPRTRFQSAPLYPHEAKKDGRSGEVVVEFIVDESGRVHDARVVNSSDRVFEESALRAVTKWQFEPGRRDNKIVRFRMSVPIVFTLNE
jgi:periplasmic protein TonB